MDPVNDDRYATLVIFSQGYIMQCNALVTALLLCCFRFLVGEGCIAPLCDLLVCPDPRIITVCLEGLENILKVGEADKEMGLNGGINIYAQQVDECDGLDKIESLQNHDNNEIYEKAVKILERYWAEEEDDENLPAFPGGPPSLPPGGFTFG